MDGAVENDIAAMTLVVRRPRDISGYQALLWREAHQALVLAEDRGWPGGTLFVWGSAPGAYQFVHMAPGPNLTLLARFAPGTSESRVYAGLVSKPGLAAIVTADQSTRRFLNVSFRHRP
jgi:hypothetical protein